jgi:hypothetical protein
VADWTIVIFRQLHRENPLERAVDIPISNAAFLYGGVLWERRAAMAAQASRISRTAAAIEVDMAAAR